jgi:hypothetical protein
MLFGQVVLWSLLLVSASRIDPRTVLRRRRAARSVRVGASPVISLGGSLASDPLVDSRPGSTSADTADAAASGATIEVFE